MTSRFVVVPEVLTDQEGLVILTDYRFWAENEPELTNWCEERNVSFKGMIITFSDKMTLTEFVLRWA